MERPIRVQLRRSKNWRLPPNTVKVDRTTRWGNPFVVGATMHCGVAFHDGPLTAERAVALFRGAIEAQLRDFPAALDELQGRNLACWCTPDAPCHADVLLDLANG